MISREDEIPAREGRRNNNNNDDDDGISTSRFSRCHLTPGLVAAYEFLFQRGLCVPGIGARVKLHPALRRFTPTRLRRCTESAQEPS